MKRQDSWRRFQCDYAAATVVLVMWGLGQGYAFLELGQMAGRYLLPLRDRYLWEHIARGTVPP